MSGNCIALFCVGCSSFSDKLARMKTLRTLHHKSGRETVCLCLWESYIEYFLCHAIWLHVKLTCRVGIPARFNKRKQNKRYGEKTIPLVFYVDMFVGKYSRKWANGEGKRKKENKKSPTRTFFILHRETILEAPPRFELGIKVLQTFALPLGYSADWSGLRGSNSLPPPWQGGALPDELNPQWRSGWDSNPRPLPWQGSVLTNWTTRP